MNNVTKCSLYASPLGKIASVQITGDKCRILHLNLEINSNLSPNSNPKPIVLNTPYSKMAAIKIFFCFYSNKPLMPRS